jgi:SAM-dependent methyltransferase
MNLDSTKWNSLAKQWMGNVSPVAPSDGDIENYLRHCNAKDEQIALILGCTSKLRKTLSSHYKQVISVDSSQEMLSVSKYYHESARNEVFVCSDWLSIPFSDNTIDTVVGDKVFDNVPPENWGLWLREIHRILKQGGRFVTRLSPRGMQIMSLPKFADFSAIVKKWSDVVRAGDSTYEESCSSLWEDCLASSTVTEDQLVGIQSTARILPSTPQECLSHFIGQQVETKLVELFIARYWESRSFQWSAYTLEGVIRAATPFFSVGGMLVANDYAEAHRQPVLLLVSTT